MINLANGRSPAPATPYSQAYFEAFVLTMVIIWLPGKLLAYFSPFVFTVWFILRGNSGKTLLNLFAFFASAVLIVI